MSFSLFCRRMSTTTGTVRVPLAKAVRHMTHQWSREYLEEAKAGDVDAMCLIAQMYQHPGGWGALPHDLNEAKKYVYMS